LAKQAFDEAIGKLGTLSEEPYKDNALIMQLLKGQSYSLDFIFARRYFLFSR